MKASGLQWQAACVAAALGLLMGCSDGAAPVASSAKSAQAGEAARDDDPVIALSDLPDAVRAAFAAAVPGGAIREVVLEDEDGQQVYGALIETDGKVLDVKVDPSGKLVKVEADDEAGEGTSAKLDEVDRDDVQDEVEETGADEDGDGDGD